MIDAYVWPTPNGQKLLVALEELGLPHTVKWINIGKGEQKTPEFLAINPNGKIPAIVDHEGPSGAPLSLFESGAILTYLADKAGKLIAPPGPERYLALEWMFFNAGGVGPMTGQLSYHTSYAPEKDPKAIERFTKEVQRLFGVLDKRLGEARFLVGEEFSIVDVMNFTWPRSAVVRLGLDVTEFANLKRWLDEIETRPAVQSALAKKPG